MILLDINTKAVPMVHKRPVPRIVAGLGVDEHMSSSHGACPFSLDDKHGNC